MWRSRASSLDPIVSEGPACDVPRRFHFHQRPRRMQLNAALSVSPVLATGRCLAAGPETHGRHRAGSAGGAGAPGRSARAAQCHPISVPSPFGLQALAVKRHVVFLDPSALRLSGSGLLGEVVIGASPAAALAEAGSPCSPDLGQNRGLIVLGKYVDPDAPPISGRASCRRARAVAGRGLRRYTRR